MFANSLTKYLQQDNNYASLPSSSPVPCDNYWLVGRAMDYVLPDVFVFPSRPSKNDIMQELTAAFAPWRRSILICYNQPTDSSYRNTKTLSADSLYLSLQYVIYRHACWHQLMLQKVRNYFATFPTWPDSVRSLDGLQGPDIITFTVSVLGTGKTWRT